MDANKKSLQFFLPLHPFCNVITFQFGYMDIALERGHLVKIILEEQVTIKLVKLQCIERNENLKIRLNSVSYYTSPHLVIIRISSIFFFF